jgi:hypothetical protein
VAGESRLFRIRLYRGLDWSECHGLYTLISWSVSRFSIILKIFGKIFNLGVSQIPFFSTKYIRRAAVSKLFFLGV